MSPEPRSIAAALALAVERAGRPVPPSAVARLAKIGTYDAFLALRSMAAAGYARTEGNGAWTKYAPAAVVEPGARLTSHHYSLTGRPYVIAVCDTCSAALNSGHHYPPQHEHHAAALVAVHNHREHGAELDQSDPHAVILNDLYTRGIIR